jgi:hypothetical protein
VAASGLSSAAAATGALPTSPPRWTRGAALLVPFLAAAAGKPLQIALMRSDELVDGVTVTDAAGTPQGRSTTAGRWAVGMTVATRTLYLFPMLYLPLIEAWMFRSSPLLRRSRVAATVAYAAVTALSSAYATPLCIALFDQRASLPAAALEPAFHGRIDGGGHAIERYFFNKGL